MPSTERSPSVIATDLDGTLLRDDGTVSARTRAALDLAEAAGATVIFVTGRPPRWVDVLVDEVGPHGLAVCANGALVYDVPGRRVIQRHDMSAEAALKVAQAIREQIPGVAFAMERGLTYGREPMFRHRWALPEGALETDLENLLAEPVAKLLARHEELEPDEFVKLGTSIVGDLATITFSDGTALLEISGPGVSKASTLAAVCEERGYGPDDVVAFGDMPNDVLMLEWAGMSYAMANAHPLAAAAAAARCGSNEEDGVARVLERLFG